MHPKVGMNYFSLALIILCSTIWREENFVHVNDSQGIYAMHTSVKQKLSVMHILEGIYTNNSV